MKELRSFGRGAFAGKKSPLNTGASLIAMCGFLVAAPALAQSNNADSQADNAGEIIVTGIRQSLASAQQIKKKSDTIVDAITANDIGALPDRSVTEALQRVPGVSINRFAGSNDPDHFSVEGSGVVVRGLNFVRSEFNGRDAFSAGVGGQSLNFADVPSELLGSVEVYKNVTAEMIEGGLAGTVNLNTRKPFDNKGFHLGFDAQANYGDMEKKWSPTGSLLVSNTWNTAGGSRIGILGDISYSRVRSRADGVQVTNFQTRDGKYVGAANSGGGTFTCRNPLPLGSDANGFPANMPGSQGVTKAGDPCYGAAPAGANGFADWASLRYAPLGGQFRTQDFDRKRDGQALTFQFESPDSFALITAQFMRSHTTNAWGEHTFETAPDLTEYSTYPKGCRQNGNGTPGVGNNPPPNIRAECPVGGFTDYTYSSDGLFQKGYITYPGTGWRTAGSGNGATNWVPSGGLQQSLSRRQILEENTLLDFGLNGKFKFSDRLDLQLDFDYTDSVHNNLDVSSFGSTFADTELDLTGDLPIIIPHKPTTLSATWAAPNPTLVAATDAQYFANPNVQFWRAAMDHIEHSTGHELALKADLAYNFDADSFLKKLKFGARYADRDQTVRYTTYNWGSVSEIWSGAGPAVSIQQGGLSHADLYSFPDFFRNKVPAPITAFYYNGDLIGDYKGSSAYFKSLNAIWHNVNGAGPGGWVPLAERPNAIAGTDYTAAEVQPIEQQDYNAYLMASFGTAPGTGKIGFSGNVGVRFVHSFMASTGSIGVPSQQDLNIASSFAVRCPSVIPPPPAPQVPTTPGGVCARGPAGYAALQQWATGKSANNTVRTDYTYWLPSLNVRVDLTDQLLMRFAASKVLTRPENSYVRNYLGSGLDNGGNIRFTAGNPFLKPATAWQFDVTAEWYFSRVGSLTFDAFYKDVSNFFYQHLTSRPVLSNGITENVTIIGPDNFHEHGKIKGFEAAYQQTLDFLPKPFDGFGINANYSYVESKGLPNAFLNGGSPDNISTVAPAGNMPLEGLSKHNINAAVFYEKGPISVRAAYNWRSRFLLTVADVIFPYYSIFNEPTGQLDASIFFNVSKQIKIGVQGVNLTNEITKTSQAYTGDPNVLAPRSYFMNDRRFSFIVRGNF